MVIECWKDVWVVLRVRAPVVVRPMAVPARATEVSELMSEVVFTEKCCSLCGKINWDSNTGGYNEEHKIGGKTMKCDTNGEKRRWDANNNRVW